MSCQKIEGRRLVLGRGCGCVRILTCMGGSGGRIQMGINFYGVPAIQWPCTLKVRY